MTMVERFGEGLARRMDRRRVLRRSAVAAFGLASAWAVEGFAAPAEVAQTCAATSSRDQCNLPGVGSCGRKGCNGAACKGACKLDTSWYETGCWCTLTGPTGPNGAQGYYTCCDCRCNGQRRSCGCSEWHAAAA